MIVQLYCIRTVSGAKSVHSTSKPWIASVTCMLTAETTVVHNTYTRTHSTIHMLILKASDNNKSTLNTQLVPIRIHTDFLFFCFSRSMFFGGIVNVGNVCICIECCLYAKFHNSDSISVKTCNNFQAQFSTNRRTMRTFSRSNSRIFALVWLSLALYHCWSDSMYLNF